MNWIKMWCENEMEYQLAIKKNEILPFATTWMNLGSVMLNKSDRGKQILYDFTYVWNLKKQKQTNEAKWKQTHKQRETNW